MFGSGPDCVGFTVGSLLPYRLCVSVMYPVTLGFFLTKIAEGVQTPHTVLVILVSSSTISIRAPPTPPANRTVHIGRSGLQFAAKSTPERGASQQTIAPINSANPAY